MLKQFPKNTPGAWGGLAKVGWWIILAVALLVIPQFSGKYTLTLVNMTLINIIAVTGLNLLTGYTGIVSMGNAAFMGIGAFIAGILAAQYGLPFWLAIIVGGLVAMLVGILIGLPALRLKGFYLLLATLALHFIAAFAMVQYQTTRNLLSGIRFPKMVLAGVVFDTQTKSYYLFLVITVLVILFVYNLLRTALGRSFVAIRDNESAAKAMGVNVAYTKLVAFAISSFIVGLAGGLMGFSLRNVTAEIFTMEMGIDHIVALFLGGQAALFGPVLGAAFVTLLPEFIGGVAKLTKETMPVLGNALDAHGFEIRTFIYGLSIVLVLIFKPAGLAGAMSDLFRFIKRFGQKKNPPDHQEHQNDV